MACSPFAAWILLTACTASTPQSPAPPARPAATQPTAPDGRRDRIAEIVGNAIDQKHGGQHFRSHAILQGDFTMMVGDTVVEGRLSFQINGSAVRLDLADGTSLGFSDQRAWRIPAGGDATAIAADGRRLQTLRRLLAAPFMRQTSGASLSAYRASTIMGGDADGWLARWTIVPDEKPSEYVAYADARSHKLIALGGATLARDLALPVAADQNLGAAFSDLVDVQGALIPTTLTFYSWTEAAGLHGDAIGTIRFANARFLNSGEVEFTPQQASSAVPAKPANP